MYWILRFCGWGLSLLSQQTLERIARGLATLAFSFVRYRRTLVLSNIATAFPDMPLNERIKIAKTSIFHLILTYLEFFRSRQVDGTTNVEFEGKEYVQEALAKGGGMYILCAHIGNWELMGGAINRYVVPTYTPVKKVGSASINRFVSELREHNHFRIVKRSRKGEGTRKIAEALQRGEGVGFVMDQTRPGEPKLPFFGRPAKTNASFAAIHRKFSAPIIPSFIYRQPSGKYRVVFWPPVELERTEDAAADIRRHSLQFNQVVEKMIRQHPEQYFWLHDRWKE